MVFRVPTRITIRPGVRFELASAAMQHGWERVFLVFDPGLAACPWPDEIISELKSATLRVTSFSDVCPNPDIHAVDLLAEKLRSSGADVVVALGGGSVLDAGKCAAMLVHNSGSCADYEGKNRFRNRSVPFVAIPTTCGTGSEVTWVSVISDHANGRKFSVKDENMYPFMALVDSDLIETLPPSLIATTGMDALTHAIESFISKDSNPVSDALALAAIRLLFSGLESCFLDPKSSGHRETVMQASTLAGMSFGSADVGAVHCLSESIGGQCDLPHGLLNAVLLHPVLEYQTRAISDRLGELSREVFTRGENILEQIAVLSGALEVPSSRDIDVPEEKYGIIAALSERNNSNGSNRMKMEAEDYKILLRQLF
jgi:alcohol dehydrogenase class IV